MAGSDEWKQVLHGWADNPEKGNRSRRKRSRRQTGRDDPYEGNLAELRLKTAWGVCAVSDEPDEYDRIRTVCRNMFELPDEPRPGDIVKKTLTVDVYQDGEHKKETFTAEILPPEAGVTCPSCLGRLPKGGSRSSSTAGVKRWKSIEGKTGYRAATDERALSALRGRGTVFPELPLRETLALLREYGVSGTDSELEEWLRFRGFEVERQLRDDPPDDRETHTAAAERVRRDVRDALIQRGVLAANADYPSIEHLGRLVAKIRR